MSIIIQLISMIFVLIAFFQQVIASVEFSDGKKQRPTGDHFGLLFFWRLPISRLQLPKKWQCD